MKLAGKSLVESGISNETGLNVVALQKADSPAVNPSASTVLEDSQELVLLGTAAQRDAFRAAFE
jgi:K+/H+ antiporter YhaU regulatory subunit KhtT